MKQLLMILMVLATLPAGGATITSAKELIYRIFDYTRSIDSTVNVGYTSYAYTRANLRIDRKNPTLLLVPSVYAIAHRGQREYLTENYVQVTIDSAGTPQSRNLLSLTTVPHRHRTMTSLLKYLTPRIYDETIIDDYILSPFNRINRKLYRYQVAFQDNGTARITFVPKRKNTQLVTGDAIVNTQTGRISRCSFSGDYDMVQFWLTIHMARRGLMSLLPERCELRTRFSFIGSKISGHYLALYDLPRVTADSITHEDDPEMMNRVRPDTLSPRQQKLIDETLAQLHRNDSLARLPERQKHRNWAKEVLWDVIGDNVLNRFNTHFGLNNAGYMRINPILNPLYMGYDHHRGFTYKFDVRASYQLDSNRELTARLKAGYAFKQHQLYFRLPIYYYLNKRKNSYLQLEIGNGNHIRSASVRRDIETELPDTVGMNLPNFDLLNEFRQDEVHLLLNYNFDSKLGFQVGALYQCRTAVNPACFRQLGWEYRYRAFSPTLELQYRPYGWQGPIFTADYNRSFRGILGSNTGYERIELNAEYIHHIHRLRSLQMRAGAGFYTWKDKRAYFLDYENFRENNIPGGWNDDWSGEFELLRSDTYNNSEYYARANVTYESPMLLVGWLPWLGKYMEMERIYVSALDVKHVHPYIEIGYGFTTRLFSCGLFVSNGKGNRTFGCKFGFELFRHW
jgi:hypothetical protein